jgi:hypothetical protein
VTPARGPPPIDLPWRTQRVRADQQVYAKRAAVVAAECDARAADVVFADPEQQRPDFREHPVAMLGDRRQAVSFNGERGMARHGRGHCREHSDSQRSAS